MYAEKYEISSPLFLFQLILYSIVLSYPYNPYQSK